ncbi:signal peptidase I [Nocardioides caeni]|uniref:signal peptidase I n=1 Tax=Nocardioides caeni TaxID=574700 RepID=UPI001EE8CA1C|nr:signal peptidase I [Nocardioides caeni]
MTSDDSSDGGAETEKRAAGAHRGERKASHRKEESADPREEPAVTAPATPAGRSQTRPAASSRTPEPRKHLPVWQESILLLAVALGLAVLIKALFVQAFYIPSESMEPGLVKDDRILVQKVSYWFGGSPQRGDVVVFEDPGEWLGATDTPAPTGLTGLLSKVGLYPTGGHLVKRVIGVEGDVVVCCDDEGRIEVNGQAIDESDYLGPDPGVCSAPISEDLTQAGDLAETELGGESGNPDDVQGQVRPCGWSVGPIPDDKLLVLGDNRGHSADSRVHLCGIDDDYCTQSPWVDEDLVVGKVFTLIWPQDRWRWISRPEAFADVPDGPSAALLATREGKRPDELGPS